MTKVPTSPVARNSIFCLDDPSTPAGMPQAVPRAVPVDVQQVTFEQALASVLARIRSGIALTNPVVSFSEHARGGDYNAITDGEYNELLDQTELVADAWDGKERLDDSAALVGRIALGGRDAWVAWLLVEPLTHGPSGAAVGSLGPVPVSDATSARVERMREVAAGLEDMLGGRLGERVTNPAIDLARHDRLGEAVFGVADRPAAAAALDQLSRDVWHELPRMRVDVVCGRILMQRDFGEAALDDLRCVRRLIAKNNMEGGEPS